jgi:hypothetical protein
MKTDGRKDNLHCHCHQNHNTTIVNTHQKQKGSKSKAENKRASQVAVLQNRGVSRAKWVQNCQRLQEDKKARLRYGTQSIAHN